jgi:hypothetical protein
MNTISYIIMVVYPSKKNLYISFRNKMDINLIKIYKSTIDKYKNIIISQDDDLTNQ